MKKINQNYYSWLNFETQQIKMLAAKIHRRYDYTKTSNRTYCIAVRSNTIFYHTCKRFIIFYFSRQNKSIQIIHKSLSCSYYRKHVCGISDLTMQQLVVQVVHTFDSAVLSPRYFTGSTAINFVHFSN